jgi:tRNA A-37 threonylcarbamoyl transferase component Bud32
VSRQNQAFQHAAAPAALLCGALALALPAPAGAADSARLLELQRVAARHSTQALAVATAATWLAALLALRARSRAGEVSVAIEYPAEWQGTFTVRLLPGRGDVRPASRAGPESRPQRSTRAVHCGVSRETCFRRVAPGAYRVVVEGELRDRRTGAPQRDSFDVLEVSVRARETARADLDLSPRLCPVHVTVLWNRQPARDVQIALFAQPNTLRYARKGTASLGLPPGEHRLIVGSGDRVAERVLAVTDFQPYTLEVDLGEGEVLFKGCPHAVIPYLAGDLSAAARALEQEGQRALAQRLEAHLQESMGNARRAASLYRDSGDWTTAARLLERIGPEDSHYVDACEMLAEHFEREGQLEQAIGRLQQALARTALRPRRRDLQERLAALHERCEELPRALEILEQLREDHPDREGLHTRIESLRKRLSLGQVTSLAMEPPDAGQSRYEILEQIGAGGMGVVFRARDRRLGREVALKRLAENLRDNPTALELVQREARAAAALNHPNIVTLYDADEEEGRFFITMELLRGSPLSTLLRREERFAPRDVARLGRQVAAGLEYAHGRGVIHRDIKPANLFLCESEVLKIMDFGLAKLLEEVRRNTTVLAGTPCYMAPEQTAQGPVGPPADLYALGVTLFELLVGTVPFREGNLPQQHRDVPPADPRDVAPGTPDALAELALALLAKHPDERPTAAAAREQLDRVAAQLPIGV